MTAANRQIRLAARPQGEVKPGDWEHADAPLAEPGDGEFAGRTRFISLDPAMRGWLDDRPSYLPPVGLGEVMRAGSVVEVTASNHPRYQVGDFVVGTFGVQEHVVSDGRGSLRVDPSAAPLSTYLGALGMPGMTAYFGLLEVGALKEGETVVVSGAAGAVGSIVGQIAKVKGCRVIGIAGGADKCALLTDELGFDAAIDYRSEDVRKALREHAPDGIDVYFDNVGGPILDAALTRLAMHARVVVCGAISQYNAESKVEGPSNYLSLLVRRARMEGFVVFDYAARYKEAAAEMAGWIAEGRLKVKEHIVRGTVDDFPGTLQMLFRGENVGKLVLELV
ncbi:NADP-dependent oxidoreductase [Kitasatospora sp. NPDC051914]|uniref:NADP-dependent oxidoreductase n=1 Tax=Kitasatospora sp. NPDC051914 TaxID=3154945 RepID=UPI0034373B32